MARPGRLLAPGRALVLLQRRRAVRLRRPATPSFADLYGPAQREETSPNEAFLEDWLLRTVQIIDRYRPQVLWFDWWIETPGFEPYLRKLAAYYYNRAAEWGREVVIQYKHSAFLPGTAVFDVERGGTRRNPRGALAERHLGVPQLVGLDRGARLQDGAGHRRRADRRRREERLPAAQHRPEAGRHGAAAGAGAAGGCRRLAERQRRGDLRHHALGGAGRGPDRGGRRLLHRWRRRCG